MIVDGWTLVWCGVLGLCSGVLAGDLQRRRAKAAAARADAEALARRRAFRAYDGGRSDAA